MKHLLLKDITFNCILTESKQEETVENYVCAASESQVETHFGTVLVVFY